MYQIQPKRRIIISHWPVEYSTLTFELSTREFTVKFNKGSGIVPSKVKDMNLILGLSIGIPAAVIALGAVGVILYLFKFRKK